MSPARVPLELLQVNLVADGQFQKRIPKADSRQPTADSRGPLPSRILKWEILHCPRGNLEMKEKSIAACPSFSHFRITPGRVVPCSHGWALGLQDCLSFSRLRLAHCRPPARSLSRASC